MVLNEGKMISIKGAGKIMRCFSQITKHIQIKKGILFSLIFTYLLLITSAIMTTPTNAKFTSETTLEGQIVVSTEVGSAEDQDNEDHNAEKTEHNGVKQDSEKQKDKNHSSDEEKEEDTSTEESAKKTEDLENEDRDVDKPEQNEEKQDFEKQKDEIRSSDKEIEEDTSSNNPDLKKGEDEKSKDDHSENE